MIDEALSESANNHIPARELGSFCGIEECSDNATYSSQVWHVDIDAREVMTAYSSEDKGELRGAICAEECNGAYVSFGVVETDLGIVFERQWTRELHLAMKDVPSETVSNLIRLSGLTSTHH